MSTACIWSLIDRNRMKARDNLNHCRYEPAHLRFSRYNSPLDSRVAEAYELALKQIVLLPGMDGTGQLFDKFVEALPHALSATAVSYPSDRFLSYNELISLVSAEVPKDIPFVLLAESFSTPVALAYAATDPQNMAALVICAGFVGNPVGGAARFVRLFARPWLFRMRPPRWFLEYFLIGENAPPELVEKIRRTLQVVSPEVLSRRLHEVLDYDARNDLARAKIPIMYLQGSNDRLLSASCYRAMLRIRPGIILASVPGPHLLLQREPQKTADLVVDFIERLGV